MPEYEVVLPKLHPDQVAAFFMPGRYKAIRCGRRWGKSLMASAIAADAVVRGQSIGWFTPSYKFQSESFADLADILAPIISASSKMEGVIRTITGGRIDFWSLENERAGRSRRYHKVIIDEAAFAKPNMMDIWEKSIKPTLLDFQGSALALSNTKGADSENFFWRICNEPKHGFVQHHAPTLSNPHVPKRDGGETDAEWQSRRDAEFSELKATTPPLVYKQEYEAEFVDWGGVRFFDVENMLPEGRPVEWPTHCATVFAKMDSATKTGKQHDGTGVAYWAYEPISVGIRLYLLDWELRQISGDLLVEWIPTVFSRLEEMAKVCLARLGSIGVHVEDQNSGSILIPQGQRRGWPVTAIDGKLTSMGKSERAIAVSGYVYQKMVAFTQPAFDRTLEYHGRTKNHMLTQVSGFTIGAENDPKSEDDLLDAFTYGIALTLGTGDGG